MNEFPLPLDAPQWAIELGEYFEVSAAQGGGWIIWGDHFMSERPRPLAAFSSFDEMLAVLAKAKRSKS